MRNNSKLSDNFSFIDGENNGKVAEHSYQFLPNMDNKVDYTMTMNEREIKKQSDTKSGRPKSRRDIKRDKFESDLEKFRQERASLNGGERMQRRIG